MHAKFYGFHEAPFSITPDPSFLYFSDSHRDALNSLKFGINERCGFMVLIGEVGTGKTTLCRKLMQEMETTWDHYEFALITNPRQTESEMLGSIIREMGEYPIDKAKDALIQQLNRILLEKINSDKEVVLLIDEAQNMDFETLEGIRLLSNFETENRKLLQIILVGQPELKSLLRDNRLRQLRQRIAVTSELHPLKKDQVINYIHHRLNQAKPRHAPVFSDMAFRLIYWKSKGVPRLINRICDISLLSAAAKSSMRVSFWDTLSASSDLSKL